MSIQTVVKELASKQFLLILLFNPEKMISYVKSYTYYQLLRDDFLAQNSIFPVRHTATEVLEKTTKGI